MKLLHTSDILLGCDFSHCHAVADRLRAARMAALRGLLALARREQADAVVVAGNLWADNRVGQTVIEEAAGLLSKSAVPVYLLPGHRDPMTADSPYELYPDRFEGGVKILSSAEPLVLKGGLTLLPFPVKSRNVGGDPTRSLPDREREPLRVAVVNTSPQGYRLAPGGLQKRELDYLCAGGEVSRRTEGDVHWSGSPEATDFGQDCGTVTIVDLDPGQPARTRQVSVASLEWREDEATVGSARELQDLARVWAAHEQRAALLLRLTLRGELSVGELVEVESLRRTLGAKLLRFELRNQVVPNLQGVSYQHPLLRAVATSLAEQAARADHRPGEGFSQAQVASQALSLLLRSLEASPHSDLV